MKLGNGARMEHRYLSVHKYRACLPNPIRPGLNPDCFSHTKCPLVSLRRNMGTFDILSLSATFFLVEHGSLSTV